MGLTGKIRHRVLCVVAAMCVASGCATAPRQLTFADLGQRGRLAGLETCRIEGKQFTLAALAPVHFRFAVLRVYIEGDGLAWRTRRLLSAHPSPVNPTALNLMLADPIHDKAYLARPCQYLQTDACHPRYWSTYLFAPEVISDMDRALDALKALGGYDRLELVGFSGGGAMAALLSAGRDDVDSLTTVAGNLDTEAFCRIHGLSPLAGSMNPADVAELLATIPQRHFVGKDDTVIPPVVCDSFVSRMAPCIAPSPVLVDHVTHQGGWEAQWPFLLRFHRPKPCRLPPP
ncbi:alpha/beta hydrolase [Desulfoluna butyratoxydans]|uniref:Alpha/beta hydrolase fold n=1 Tax=Desulfoluna butyratoxydans TaxID=231438 RepID=A0A4V6ILE3_9BACT|nr:alpha/beta hydrolase [Desulfoluna butyratoxydans]VFQ44488.1 alpha/beta hydrolase fold [Desulfoluna butyratoxydans]